MFISVSAHTHTQTVVSPKRVSDAYFGVLVRWEERVDRDEGVYEMISAEGLALFLPSLPL